MAGALQITNEEFVCSAFAQLATDEWVWVTGFAGDPGGIPHGYWGGVAAPPLPRWIRPDHNNYIAVSSFKRGHNNCVRRAKACFAAMHVLMIDDVGTKVPANRLLLEPSALVETSPGNHQAWYFLSAPEYDQHRAAGISQGLVAMGLTNDGTDPGMLGVTRYGRLPVGINGKAKYFSAEGHPFEQRLVEWNPSRRYSLDEIAAPYQINLGAPPRRAPKLMRTARPADVAAASATISSLTEARLYVEELPAIAGAHRIVCPWYHEHTDEDQTGTVYFEPSPENLWHGGFKCHHGHCQERTVANLKHFLNRFSAITQQNR